GQRVPDRAGCRGARVGHGRGVPGRPVDADRAPRAALARRVRRAVRSEAVPAASGRRLRPPGEASPHSGDLTRRTTMALAERFARGKVRDIYEAGDDRLLVATDRISAFDVVLPTLSPDKGRVLTALTLFWLDRTRDVVPNHLLTADVREFPAPFTGEPELAGRSML